MCSEFDFFCDLELAPTYSTGVNKILQNHSTKFSCPGKLSPGFRPVPDVEHTWWKYKDKYIAHLRQQWHNSKCVIFPGKILKVFEVL
jgi:hypothetical protein